MTKNEEYKTSLMLDIDFELLDLCEMNFSMDGLKLQTCVTFSCLQEIAKYYDIDFVISDLQLADCKIEDVLGFAEKNMIGTKFIIYSDDKVHKKIANHPSTITVLSKSEIDPKELIAKLKKLQKKKK